MSTESLSFLRPGGAAASWPAHLCLLPAVALLACVVSRLDVGLELSDEAYNLLYAIHASGIGAFFSPFQWVTGPLWTLTGNLVAFRAAGVLLSLAAALLLAAGVLRAAQRVGLPAPGNRAGRTAMLAVAASAALLYGSVFPFTPSYNLMATVGANAAMGLCLLSICSGGRRATVLAAASGLAVGLCFLSKFSSGICTAGLLVLLWLVLAGGTARLQAGTMAAAAAATVLAVAQANGGIGAALDGLRVGTSLVFVATGDGSTSGRLVRSLADLRDLLAATAVAFWIPLACFALALRWRSGPLHALGVLSYAVLLLTGRHLAGGYEHFFLQAQPLLAALLMALLAWLPECCRDIRRIALVAVLVGLPAAVALGSSNPLQMQILMSLGAWGVLLGLLGFAARTRLALAALAWVFCGVVLAQVIGSAVQPYRIPPLAQHTERIELPRLGAVRVDPVTAELARQFGQGARSCGIAAGEPFLDVYNAPGVALLLDLRPVISPWLNEERVGSALLAHASADEIRRAVVAARHHPGQRLVPPRQLAGFPTGYRLCATAASPYDGARMELWAPPR